MDYPWDPEQEERAERHEQVLDRIMPHRRLLKVAVGIVTVGLVGLWVLWLRSWSH